MIRNNLTSKSSYLSSCDFINKYVLIQAEKAPFLSKVSLELSLIDVYNALERTYQNDRSFETKTRLFLVLYIFRIFQPIIRCNSVAKVKENDKSFLLRISFSTEKDIQCILTILFTENWRPSLKKYQKKQIDFKTNAESLLGIKHFLEKNLLGIDSSKLHINCKFMFENKDFKNKKISTKMIRNMVPFWISC